MTTDPMLLKEALVVAVSEGVTEAKRRTGICRSTIHKHLKKAGLTAGRSKYGPDPVSKRPIDARRGKFTEAERLKWAMKAEELGFTEVAKLLGVTRQLIGQWRQRFGLEPLGGSTFPPAKKRKAIEIARNEGTKIAEEKTGIGRSTIRNWCIEAGIELAEHRYFEIKRKLREDAVVYSVEHGVIAARKKFGVKANTLTSWRRRAGVCRPRVDDLEKREKVARRILKQAAAEGKPFGVKPLTTIYWAIQLYQKKNPDGRG